MNNTYPPQQHIRDPRPALVLALFFGVSIWQLTPLALIPIAACLGYLVMLPRVRSGQQPGTIKTMLLFCLFWGGVKFALDITLPNINGNISLERCLIDALLLSARLALLSGIGILLTLWASPRALGLSLAWLLRPFLGSYAWRPALALALMIHFLPITQQTIHNIRQSMVKRHPYGKIRRIVLLPAAVLRILSQKTWHQTVAVAMRGLDTPEAWTPHFHTSWRVWGGTLFIIVLGLSLYLIP